MIRVVRSSFVFINNHNNDFQITIEPNENVTFVLKETRITQKYFSERILRIKISILGVITKNLSLSGKLFDDNSMNSKHKNLNEK